MRLPFPVRLYSRRRWLIVVATVAAILGGLVPLGAAAAADPSFAQQQIAWGPCDWYSPEFGGPAPECATVTVPRDWTNPGSGPTLSISISRTRATDTAHRKGILFTNPGGPGGSGSFLSWYIAVLQPKVAAQYDIIGMDPRGVWNSTQLNCDLPVDQLTGLPSYDSRDQSPEALAVQHKVEKLIADSCAKNPLTRYVNTWQTTHDMDLIRDRLGEAKLNYLGYSYGTWLGAKYAALFPANTGKVILDSNTSWMDDLSASWELMPMAVQRRFEKQFEPWTTRSIFAKDLGATPAQISATYEQIRAGYATFYRAKVGGNAGGDVVDSFLFSSMYTDVGLFGAAFTLGLLKVCVVDNTDWSQPTLDACVNDYIDRISKDLSVAQVQQVQPTVHEVVAQLFGNTPAVPTVPGFRPDTVASIQAAARGATGDTVSINGVFYAVRCGDGGQWHNASWWDNYARTYGPVYPIGGYLISQEVCSYWTAPTQTLPNPDEHRLAGPIVTVQSEFDPATAYENTSRNVAQFHDARLIAVDDAGAHGQYGLRGNSCVDDAVNGYLLDNVVPPASTVCGATPLFLEDTVYPQVGPVDSKTPPKAVHASLVNQEVQRRMDKLIK